MNPPATPAIATPFSPLRLNERPLALQVGAVIFGSALMTASSYI